MTVEQPPPSYKHTRLYVHSGTRTAPAVKTVDNVKTRAHHTGCNSRPNVTRKNLFTSHHTGAITLPSPKAPSQKTGRQSSTLQGRTVAQSTGPPPPKKHAHNHSTPLPPTHKASFSQHLPTGAGSVPPGTTSPSSHPLQAYCARRATPPRTTGVMAPPCSPAEGRREQRGDLFQV